MVKCLLLISALLSSPLMVISQTYTVADYRKELNIKLSANDDKRLEKGVETLNDAEKIQDEALQLLSSLSDTEKMAGVSPAYQKSIKKLLEASETFRQGHTLIYTVYDENCEKFSEKMKKDQQFAAGMNKATYYRQTSKKTKEKADRIRDLLLQADKPEWIQYKMNEAFQLEKLAIRDIGRALQIYQDFPVEYNYGWDDDISDEQLAKIFKNPIVNLPPEDVFKAKPKADTVNKEAPIIFRVQIAAHTIHLTDHNIKAIYRGHEKVMELKEGIWYKYQIGGYTDFQEANKLLQRCGVQDAFIVAYQNGKRLSIHEAMKKIYASQ